MSCTSRRRFLGQAGAAALAGLLPARAWAAPDTCALFSLNVQDFSYPDLSIDLVRRALDLHESLGVPVGVYLTTTQVDLFQALAPDLLERLRRSPWAEVCYHTRAPLPYRTGYDWAGLAARSRAEQYAVVREYETHGLDLASGLPTAAPGGYAHLASLLLEPPLCVGDAADGALQTPVDEVYRDLGARFAVAHGRASNVGDRRNGLLLRPEHCDLMLFEHVGAETEAVLSAAVAAARAAAGARAPYVVGIKMHDNDFFATASAWTTVYLSGPRRPPWDPTKKAPLLSAAEQAAAWETYRAMVELVAASAAVLPAVSLRSLAPA